MATNTHYHALSSRYGVAEFGRSQCDGVFWDGSAWRVCLKGLVPEGEDGSRKLEPIETAYHGGETGCREALRRWMESINDK